MKRTEKLKEKTQELIDQGRRPSTQLLAEELGWMEEDVHSCLNTLEKNREVETYKKELLGRKIRLVSVKR